MHSSLANLRDIFSLHNNFILLLKVKHRDLSSFFSAAHITAAPHASTRSNNSQNISKLTTAPHKSYLLKLLAAFSFVRSDEKVSLQAYIQCFDITSLYIYNSWNNSRTTVSAEIHSIYLSISAFLLYSKLPRQEEERYSVSD